MYTHTVNEGTGTFGAPSVFIASKSCPIIVPTWTLSDDAVEAEEVEREREVVVVVVVELEGELDELVRVVAGVSCEMELAKI